MKTIALCCIILLSSALCGAIAQEALKLTIDEAISLGVEHNLDLFLAQLDFENARRELERQEIIGEEEELEEARENFERSRENLATVTSNLKLNIETSYFELLKTMERLASQEEALVNTERLFALDEARFKAGYIAELALIKSKNSLLVAQASYENQVQSFITQLYRFKDLLGIPLEQEIELLEGIDVNFSPIGITLEEAIASAFLHAESLEKAQKALEDAKANVRASDNEYTPLVELERAITREQESRVALKKAENLLFLDVRSAFFNVIQRENAVYQGERELEHVIIELKIMEARFEAEVVSEEALSNARKEVISKRQELTNAILEHISAKRNLFQLIGVSQEEWEAKRYGEHGENDEQEEMGQQE